MLTVDVQRHWTPQSYLERHVGREGFPTAERTSEGFKLLFGPGVGFGFPLEGCDVDAPLRQLDASGIDVGVVSPAPIAVDQLPRAEAEEVCIALNEAMAEAQAASAGRLLALATLPLRWPDSATAVLVDATQRLGLRGVCVPGAAGREPLVDLDIAVVLSEMARRDAVCFLHPAGGRFGKQLSHFALGPSAGFMFETTVAAYELALSGVLTDGPLPPIVHPHGGGTVPYIAERLDLYASQRRSMTGEQAPAKPSELLREMFTDTACLGPKALAMARDFYGPERLLFGSDEPFWAAAPQLALLEHELRHSPAELDAVLGQNAIGLLRLEVGANANTGDMNATRSGEAL